MGRHPVGVAVGTAAKLLHSKCQCYECSNMIGMNADFIIVIIKMGITPTLQNNGRMVLKSE